MQALSDLVFVLETEQERCHQQREYLEAMGVAIAIRRAKQMIDSRR